MANIMLAFVAVLQEESERIAGKALPTEITLEILLRWGGMVSPTVLALREDAGSRRVRECILRHTRAVPQREFSGMECYCETHKTGTIWAQYDTDQLRYVGELLGSKMRVPKELRVRRVNAHLRKHKRGWIMGDYWGSGECGTFWLWFRYLRNQHPDDKQLKTFGGSDYGVERMRYQRITKLSMSSVPERYYPYYDGARWVWGKMIEELQGQPLKEETQLKNYAEGWKMYLRADAGERV